MPAQKTITLIGLMTNDINNYIRVQIPLFTLYKTEIL